MPSLNTTYSLDGTEQFCLGGNVSSSYYETTLYELKNECEKLRKELEAKQKDNAGLIKSLEDMEKEFKVKRIIKSNNATIVFWEDGTKTIVKRASDEAESDYAAFTAAIGIKCFGSNSALKRVVARTETQKPKKEKKTADADSNYDQRKTDEWLDSIERRTR